jgi:hypothetical protein
VHKTSIPTVRSLLHIYGDLASTLLGHENSASTCGHCHRFSPCARGSESAERSGRRSRGARMWLRCEPRTLMAARDVRCMAPWCCVVARVFVLHLNACHSYRQEPTESHSKGGIRGSARSASRCSRAAVPFASDWSSSLSIGCTAPPRCETGVKLQPLGHALWQLCRAVRRFAGSSGCSRSIAPTDVTPTALLHWHS